jgi:hypothetical protein
MLLILYEFRDIRHTEGRTFHVDIGAWTVKMYDILKVKNALIYYTHNDAE